MGKQNNTENLVKSNLDSPNEGIPVDEKDGGGCREGSEVLGGEIVGYLWLVVFMAFLVSTIIIVINNNVILGSQLVWYLDVIFVIATINNSLSSPSSLSKYWSQEKKDSPSTRGTSLW